MTSLCIVLYLPQCYHDIFTASSISWSFLHRTGINDTSGIGGKFATGVVDTTVVRLDMKISPQICEKIRNYPNAIIRGSGEDDSRKKPEAKIS
jgi:hypothetical protein